MNNNDPKPTDSGQISISFPTVMPVLNGGWYMFQIPTDSNTISTDDCAVDTDFVFEEKKINKDGCICKKCNEICPYADPPDPEKFMCYSCRNNY